MNGTLLVKRYLSKATRESLYADCLNRNFDQALATLQKTAVTDIDYAFLHVYLSRSCHWGHIESVSHIWYKYVLRLNVMIVKPSLLCDIGNLALNEGKHFLPSQLYRHYIQFHANRLAINEGSIYEYELLRIKVESFAKGTMLKTRFREKWKVFLKDVDHRLPITTKLCVRDFPNLRKSIEYEDNETLMTMLFDQGKLDIRNESTLPLLLNMILMQLPQSNVSKIALFERFYESHRMLDYGDTLTILFRLCAGDGYHLNKLMEFTTNNSMLPLSAQTSKAFIDGIKNTEYSFRIDDFLKYNGQ